MDAGFLELVRYGIRKPGDQLNRGFSPRGGRGPQSKTPFGPCWRRYNHDGYGQKKDGGPFQGWGYGHAWPVLTGERGHYELAAARDAKPFIRAMEGFATSTTLLPEQVWALPGFCPSSHEFWTSDRRRHAAGVGACRIHPIGASATDGQVFGLIPEVADHYRNRRAAVPLEIWKFNRQVRSLTGGGTLRIQAASPFRLHWTSDEWGQVHETDSTSIATGHEYVDVRVPAGQKSTCSLYLLLDDLGSLGRPGFPGPRR